MESIFTPFLAPNIREHLSSVDIQSLSRLPASRISQTAIPNIGLIELVTAETYPLYDPLYISAFPTHLERERSDLITTRLADEFAHKRQNYAPYRIIGIRAPTGDPIAGAHFSILPLPGGESSVPYLQYIYVRSENRRQDLSEVLHALILAVATADAQRSARSVPFTLFETEPPGHGDDDSSRAFSTARAQVHAKSGARALMLTDPASTSLTSPHVQPGLEPSDQPLSLLWCVRPSPAPAAPYSIKDLGRSLIAAYYQSMRDEGFPEANIALAERMVAELCAGREFVLVSLTDAISYKGMNGPVE